MIPTVQNVKDAARRFLGDSEVSGGQVFTDTVLQPFVAQANAEMFRVLDDWEVQRVERNLYYNLPAYQTVFYPAQAKHANFGEPIAVRTRQPKTTVAISNAVPDAANFWCVVTTGAAHGMTSGDVAIIYGVEGVSFDINDEWTVEVVDATTVRLLGCVAVGTYSSAVDFLSSSDNAWSEPIRFMDSIADVRRLQQNTLEAVAWEADRFVFARSSVIRQIMIEYSLSGGLSVDEGTAEDANSIGVDDSLDFLGHRTASFAAASFGAVRTAQDMERKAIGSQEALDAGQPGGLLGNMVSRGVKTLQKESFETQRFRPKRTAGRVPRFIQ